MASACKPAIKILNESAGSERYRADIRRYGGMVFAFGITAMFGALANVATGVNMFGIGGTPNDPNTIPFWSFVGNVCVAFFGSLAILVGYFALVVDQGHPLITTFLLVAIQLAWIPYITGMTAQGRQAINFPDQAQGFIPERFDPTKSDVNWAAAMGICSIAAHGLAYIGSLSFMTFSLFAYQVGKMGDRSNTYFKSRMPLYNFAIFLAGFAQLAMGSLILANYSSGPLKEPVAIPFYIIFWPEISVAVGAMQMLTGIYGSVRTCCASSPTDYSFQALCMVTWLCMITLQLTVQISWAEGDKMAAALPSFACVSLPLPFMPAFLDHMARNTPDTIDESYYGLSGGAYASKAVEGEEEQAYDVSEDDEENPQEVNESAEVEEVEDDDFAAPSTQSLQA